MPRPARERERPGAQTLALTLLVVTCVAVFAALAVDVTHHGPLDRADLRIARWNALHMPSPLERVAEVVTYLGWFPVLAVLALAAAAWLAHDGRRGDAAVLLASALATSLATRLLKVAFDRPRPQVGSAVDLPASAAFPSGHTSGSFAVLVLAALLLSERAAPRLRLLAVGGALAAVTVVAATRVVLDAHYLTDVVAGACLGLAVVGLALAARLRAARRV